MRPRAFLPALALGLAFALAPALRADALEPTAEELFQWGEYDSLIRSVEPWLAARSAGADARSDSVELAQANLFLGVAYWVTDKRALAEQAFARACRLDAQVRMDRLYATPEIIARFEAIAAEERKLRERQLAAERGRLAEAERRRHASRKSALWKRWTVGALGAAGLAVGGGYAYYTLAERKQKITEIPIPVAPPNSAGQGAAE